MAAVMRQSAAVALGMAASPKDEAVVAALLKAALEDDDIGSRQMSILALGRMGGDGARAALRSLLARPGGALDVNHVVLALGVARDPKSGPLLLRVFREEKDYDLRGAAAISLALVGRKEAILSKVIERRDELALGQVARSAEDDDGARLCCALEPHAFA